MGRIDRIVREPIVERVRDAVRSLVDRTSLTVVAETTGVSRNGLHGFVHGSRPRRQTWEKLRIWYEAHAPYDAGVLHAGGRQPRQVSRVARSVAYEVRTETQATDSTAAAEVSVAQVRNAMRSRVEDVSLRAAGLEAGLSKDTVRAFVHGSDPHGHTWQQLRRWYETLPPKEDMVAQTAVVELAAAPEIRLDQVRDEVRVRVARTSLRVVAADIGVSRGAVHGLLRGSSPHGRTWKKLRAWYATLHPNHEAAQAAARRRAKALRQVEADDLLAVDQVRSLMRNRADRYTIRAVAREAGLTKSTLGFFLTGRLPGPRIRARLSGWYKRYGKAAEAEQREDAAAREVPVPELRAWVGAQLEHMEYRELAAEIGFHHSTLEAFLKRVNSTPSMHTRCLIARRYLAVTAAAETVPSLEPQAEA